MMQEHVQNHMYNGHLALFWMSEPQIFILSEQRTDIKHDWYIPSRFQKRQNSMYIVRQHNIGVWEDNLIFSSTTISDIGRGAFISTFKFGHPKQSGDCILFFQLVKTDGCLTGHKTDCSTWQKVQAKSCIIQDDLCISQNMKISSIKMINKYMKMYSI